MLVPWRFGKFRIQPINIYQFKTTIFFSDVNVASAIVHALSVCLQEVIKGHRLKIR